MLVERLVGKGCGDGFLGIGLWRFGGRGVGEVLGRWFWNIKIGGSFGKVFRLFSNIEKC